VASGPDAGLALLRALAEVDLRRRQSVYWAARASLLHRPDEVEVFDRLFERFWEGFDLFGPVRGSEHGESDPRATGPHHGGEALPQYRVQGRESTLLGGRRSRDKQEVPSAASQQDGRGNRRGLLAAYSRADVLTKSEPLSFNVDELTAVRQLAGELRATVPKRRSRRVRPSRKGGRLDVRRTLRRSLRTDGEPLCPVYGAPSVRPRRLLFLCDVSGSMDRYSRVLLASLKAAVGASRKTEAFAFATRLTRLTPTLADSDVERSLEQARQAVIDWSGGTRIGEVIAQFNRTWGRRGFARGAIALVISDGWDRGDPASLARELHRLTRQCRRLVWINPRPAALDQQPLAIGMRAALPYVDDFVPGHDPRALAGLTRLIGGLDPGRPARGRPRLDSLYAGR